MCWKLTIRNKRHVKGLLLPDANISRSPAVHSKALQANAYVLVAPKPSLLGIGGNDVWHARHALEQPLAFHGNTERDTAVPCIIAVLPDAQREWCC